ncbi:MAG TPA: hypothetical protein VMD59_03465 [Acidimicrobiales bacterium]|nr:hypothetical protein [Acidimicrobiales bacterium]
MTNSTIEQRELEEVEALEALFGDQLEDFAAEAELKIGDSDLGGPEAIVESIPIPVIWTIILKC